MDRSVYKEIYGPLVPMTPPVSFVLDLQWVQIIALIYIHIFETVLKSILLIYNYFESCPQNIYRNVPEVCMCSTFCSYSEFFFFIYI
jgi:hypothetical protein